MNLRNKEADSSRESARKNDASSFDYSLRYVRCLLRLLGVWVLVSSQRSKIEYAFSKHVLIPLVSFLMMGATLPMWYYVATKPTDRLEAIMLIGAVINEMSNIFVHFAMIVRSDLIKSCIEHIELDWKRIENQMERDIMTRYLRSSHKLTIACLISMYTTTILWALIRPLFSGVTINEMNQTIKPLAFPGADIFFDVQANVAYEIVFFLHFLASVCHLTVAVGVCILAILFVSHACGQIQIVMTNLDGVVDGANQRNIDPDFIAKRVGFVVRRHVRLLELAKNIEKTLKEMILMQVVSTTLVICCIEYDVFISLTSNIGDRIGLVTYIALFICFSFHLFLFCQFGEVLMEQCEEIGKKAYSIDWCGLPRSIKLALIMIINMSNNPYKLSAGGMMDLSIINFASIIKTSFAYFNMIRATG